MLKSSKIVRYALAAALLSFVPAMTAGEKSELDPKRLAALAESAESASDYQELGRLYEKRAAMLDEKAERHERLEKRFDTVPASLIAKRGYAWDTPRRQRDLASKARREAAEAREMAEVHTARAESASTDVD